MAFNLPHFKLHNSILLDQGNAYAYGDETSKMLSDFAPDMDNTAGRAVGKADVGGVLMSVEEASQKLGDPAHRIAALNVLAAGPDGAAYAEEVCDCLADEDAEVRIAAAAAVGQMSIAVKGSQAAFSRVLELLGHEDGRFRAAAAMAVGHLGVKAQEQSSVLQDLLGDDFQEPAVNSLTVGGCRARLPPVWRKTKCAAAVALGMLANAGAEGEWDRAAADVSRLLEDEDWEVRLAALDSLALMGGYARSEASKVAGLFEDERYPVRAKAAQACGRLGDPDAAADLADLLQDNSPAVREQALLALAELGEEGTEFIGQVYEHVLDFSPSVRAAAITSLARMGEKGKLYAGAIAQRLLQTETVNVCVAAIEALGEMEEHGAVYIDILEEYLQDQIPQVRTAAAKSLDKLRKMAIQNY